MKEKTMFMIVAVIIGICAIVAWVELTSVGSFKNTYERCQAAGGVPVVANYKVWCLKPEAFMEIAK